jgi:hypothetical protein
MVNEQSQMFKGERVARIIKRDPARDDYILRHELSLLRLFIEKYPENAEAILEKFRLQKQAA